MVWGQLFFFHTVMASNGVAILPQQLHMLVWLECYFTSEILRVLFHYMYTFIYFCMQIVLPILTLFDTAKTADLAHARRVSVIMKTTHETTINYTFSVHMLVTFMTVTIKTDIEVNIPTGFV